MRIAIILQLDTEHGRGILRGAARYLRSKPDISVWKFARSELSSPTVLRGLAPDGLIARVATPAEERTLRSLGVPLINVSGSRPTPRVPMMNTDDALVGRLAARHLLSRGYRTLAYFGDPAHLASRRRGAAFAAEAQGRGCSPVRELPPAGTGNAELAAALRRLPTPFGLFGFTDPAAIAAAEACAAAGLRVPEDAAVLGVGNDLTRLEFAQVDVSSIQLNTARIGEAAAEALCAWIGTGRRPPPETLFAPVKIVPRRSTDLFAVDDEAVAQALEHIRNHAGNPVYVTDIARAAGVSRRSLELRFRRELGTSVYAEVQRTHFERAIELLADPQLTIGEVAYASGFDSAQRFSTAFRRRYGVPPRAYRRNATLPGA